MECRTVAGSLSDYMDGRQAWLTDGEVHEIQDHLVSCPNCQNLERELAEIKMAARELPLHTPPRALWARIVNEIELEQMAEAMPSRARTSPQTWWERLSARRFTFSLPQMAGVGALALCLLVAGVVSYRTPSNDLDFTRVQSALLREENHKIAEIERKMAAINERKATWDPTIRTDFERQLNRIEESIKMCQQKLETNPKDLAQAQMKLDLYEEKRQLLEDIERLKW